MLHFAIQAQVLPGAVSPTHARFCEEAMPTTPGGFGSPRDAIRHWLSRTNGSEGHKSFVGENRPEHDVDENRLRKHQHLTDHHFGNRKVTQQETGFGLGHDRRPEVNAMPIDVGALVNTFNVLKWNIRWTLGDGQTRLHLLIGACRV